MKKSTCVFLMALGVLVPTQAVRAEAVADRMFSDNMVMQCEMKVQSGRRSGWRVADEKSIRGFSALLFSFGHALNRELKVPVGLMYGAAGGTPSGRWLTEEMASADTGFMKVFRRKSSFQGFAEMYARTALLKYPLDHIKITTIRNAPMVTTVDLAPGVHPPTKYGYRKRACRVAFGTVYGRDRATCGPVYRSHKVEGRMIRIAFNHVGKGLAFRHGNALQGFEIAGADGKWQWGTARIDGDTIVVSSKQVTRPASVRYAFSENRKPSFANLFNKDGLPALMFTSARQMPRA
jgi:hypothetical protein